MKVKFQNNQIWESDRNVENLLFAHKRPFENIFKYGRQHISEIYLLLTCVIILFCVPKRKERGWTTLDEDKKHFHYMQYR